MCHIFTSIISVLCVRGWLQRWRCWIWHRSIRSCRGSSVSRVALTLTRVWKHPTLRQAQQGQATLPLRWLGMHFANSTSRFCKRHPRRWKWKRWPKKQTFFWSRRSRCGRCLRPREAPKKPKDEDWAKIPASVMDLGKKATSACDNQSDFFHNQKAAAAAISIATLVTASSPPLHVKNVMEEMDFHAFKVMKRLLRLLASRKLRHLTRVQNLLVAEGMADVMAAINAGNPNWWFEESHGRHEDQETSSTWCCSPLLLPRSQLLNKEPKNQLGKVDADHPWRSFRKEQIGSSKISKMNKTSQLTKWRNTSSSSSSIAKIARWPFQKVTNVGVDGCLKVNFIVDDVISSVEMVNNDRCQVQAKSKVNSFAIDKCNGVNVLLPKESSQADIVSCKSSAMNVTTPDPNGEEGDQIEMSIPVQFVTKIIGPNKLQTIISDLYSSWSTELVFETISRWLVSYRKLFSTAPKSTFRKEMGLVFNVCHLSIGFEHTYEKNSTTWATWNWCPNYKKILHSWGCRFARNIFRVSRHIKNVAQGGTKSSVVATASVRERTLLFWLKGAPMGLWTQEAVWSVAPCVTGRFSIQCSTLLKLSVFVMKLSPSLSGKPVDLTEPALARTRWKNALSPLAMARKGCASMQRHKQNSFQIVPNHTVCNTDRSSVLFVCSAPVLARVDSNFVCGIHCRQHPDIHFGSHDFPLEAPADGLTETFGVDYCPTKAWCRWSFRNLPWMLIGNLRTVCHELGALSCWHWPRSSCPSSFQTKLADCSANHCRTLQLLDLFHEAGSLPHGVFMQKPTSVIDLFLVHLFNEPHVILRLSNLSLRFRSQCEPHKFATGWTRCTLGYQWPISTEPFEHTSKLFPSGVPTGNPNACVNPVPACPATGIILLATCVYRGGLYISTTSTTDPAFGWSSNASKTASAIFSSFWFIC